MRLIEQPYYDHNPQMEAIWDCMENDTCHIGIDAVAGSGKTAVSIEGLFRLPPTARTAIIAFSKPIAKTLQRKVPQGVHASTFHSMGRGVLVSAVKGAVFNEHKTYNLIPDVVKSPQLRSAIRRIVSLCKATLTDFTDFDALETMCARYGIETNGGESLKYIPRVMTKSKNFAMYDYDDMIWGVIILAKEQGFRPTKFDVLGIDEAQDMNRSRQALAYLMGDRLFWVGDRCQSIMGFSGASDTSMDDMKVMVSRTKRGVKEFPLDVTYRCPTSHVALAQKIVPHIRARDGAKEGVIQYRYRAEAQPGHMVIGRTNAVVISEAYKYIRIGKYKVKVQGRDIGRDLKTFIEKFVTATDTTGDLTRLVSEYSLKETTRIMSDQSNPELNEKKLMQLQDKCDVVHALAEGFVTVQEVFNRIAEIFDDVEETPEGSPFILFTTAHKAKGLEAETVHIIEPGLFPHPMAKTPEDIQQEQYLLYVAQTRSKNALYFH